MVGVRLDSLVDGNDGNSDDDSDDVALVDALVRKLGSSC